MQLWCNIKNNQFPIVRLLTKRIKDKTHVIISIDIEKDLTKSSITHLHKMSRIGKYIENKLIIAGAERRWGWGMTANECENSAE